MEPTRIDAADEDFLLDLLNSTPIVDGVQQDELASATVGQMWLRAHGFAPSETQWRTVREARAILQATVRGEAQPSALAPLLAEVAYRPTAAEHGIEWQLDAPRGRLAAARAVLAWDALRRHRPGRLRPCENPECALFLLDRSKPNTARWCSMAVCGNRMKARRHYERTRAAR